MNRSKFLVDEMLGSLVRWLRILGFDAVYAQDLVQSNNSPSGNLDSLLLKQTNDRILLTKDTQLAQRAKQKGIKVLLLKSNKLEENLIQLVDQLDLCINISQTSQRCPACNSQLERINKKKIKEKIPPGVRRSRKKFWICTRSSCEKIFWKGSHWESIKNIVSKLRKRKRAENIEDH